MFCPNPFANSNAHSCIEDYLINLITPWQTLLNREMIQNPDTFYFNTCVWYVGGILDFLSSELQGEQSISSPSTVSIYIIMVVCFMIIVFNRKSLFYDFLWIKLKTKLFSNKILSI